MVLKGGPAIEQVKNVQSKEGIEPNERILQLKKVHIYEFITVCLFIIHLLQGIHKMKNLKKCINYLLNRKIFIGETEIVQVLVDQRKEGLEQNELKDSSVEKGTHMNS